MAGARGTRRSVPRVRVGTARPAWALRTGPALFRVGPPASQRTRLDVALSAWQRPELTEPGGMIAPIEPRLRPRFAHECFAWRLSPKRTGLGVCARTVGRVIGLALE